MAVRVALRFSTGWKTGPSFENVCKTLLDPATVAQGAVIQFDESATDERYKSSIYVILDTETGIWNAADSLSTKRRKWKKLLATLEIEYDEPDNGDWSKLYCNLLAKRSKYERADDPNMQGLVHSWTQKQEKCKIQCKALELTELTGKRKLEESETGAAVSAAAGKKPRRECRFWIIGDVDYSTLGAAAGSRSSRTMADTEEAYAAVWDTVVEHEMRARAITGRFTTRPCAKLFPDAQVPAGFKNWSHFWTVGGYKDATTGQKSLSEEDKAVFFPHTCACDPPCVTFNVTTGIDALFKYSVTLDANSGFQVRDPAAIKDGEYNDPHMDNWEKIQKALWIEKAWKRQRKDVVDTFFKSVEFNYTVKHGALGLKVNYHLTMQDLLNFYWNDPHRKSLLEAYRKKFCSSDAQRLPWITLK